MKAQVTKTTTSGLKITVSWSASMLDKSADGHVCGQEMVSCCDSIALTKDGAEVVTARFGLNSLSETYPDIPAEAAGVIKGQRGKGQIVQPLGAEAYEMVKAAIAEAQKMAESDCEKPEPKKEIEMTINPQYTGMSREEIKAAEAQYDAVHNEGAEGYNPYRDNLYVAK